MAKLSFDLDPERKSAIGEINHKCGVVRGEFITVIPGQDLIYGVKRAGALEIIAAGGDVDPADYPMLAAEVGITGETLYQVAQIVAFKGAEFEALGGMLEKVRLGAIDAIEKAATLPAIRQAQDEFRTAIVNFPRKVS